KSVTGVTGNFAVTTVSGVKVEFPADAVVKLDYSKGKLTYLSDLQPVRVNQTFGDDRLGPYRRDKNAEGESIRLADRTYSKGLSLLPYTELVYDIGGQYKDFKAVIGLGPSGGTGRPVKVVVEADGRELFAGELRPKEQ